MPKIWRIHLEEGCHQTAALGRLKGGGEQVKRLVGSNQKHFFSGSVAAVTSVTHMGCLFSQDPKQWA